MDEIEQPDIMECECEFYKCRTERIDGDKGLFEPKCPYGAIAQFHAPLVDEQSNPSGRGEPI